MHLLLYTSSAKSYRRISINILYTLYLSCYMKFSLKTKDSTFFFIVLEKYRILGCNIGNFRHIGNIAKSRKYRITWHPAEDRVTRTPLKNWCSGRVGSSCSISATRHDNLVITICLYLTPFSTIF